MYNHTDFSIINTLLDNFQKDLKERDDIDVYVFPQTWGNTALGYGGVGGSAMTSDSTIVLHAQYLNVVRVYFGCKRLAYQIKDPDQIFFKDLYRCDLADASKAGKYIRKD